MNLKIRIANWLVVVWLIHSLETSHSQFDFRDLGGFKILTSLTQTHPRQNIIGPSWDNLRLHGEIRSRVPNLLQAIIDRTAGAMFILRIKIIFGLYENLALGEPPNENLENTS